MRTRSQLRFGLWPDGPASRSADDAPSLTIAARRLAQASIEELSKAGVTATLDKAGKAHFRATRIPPPAARRIIELHGNLIEIYLNGWSDQ